ncbi:MAG: TIGR02270 family protein [Gammaproteobacteria bacterium]|nr:TIGR02270 family protein [Gammaproteobacteria bacterium]
MSDHQQVSKDIIEEHVEEASALWAQRAKIVFRHDYFLSDLAEIDEQLSAHIDALILARQLGWDISQKAMQDGASGTLFVAAALAIHSQEQEKLDEVIATVVNALDTAEELLAVVEWFTAAEIERLFLPLLKHPSREVQLIVVQVLIIQAENASPYVLQLINANNKIMKLKGIKWAGELACRDMLQPLQALAEDKDTDIQFWSAWSATLLGDRAGPNKLAEFVNDDQYRDSALPLLIRSMSVQNAQLWLSDLGKDSRMARSVVIATGVLGDAQNIPGLIRAMYHPEFAQIAGSAFSLLTGVDLDESHLSADASEADAENRADDNITSSDDLLPMPDPDKLAHWWVEKQHQFQAGQRYLMGLPLVDEELAVVLREGNQHHRQAAALELALRHRHQPLINTASHASNQMKQLKLLQQAMQQRGMAHTG